MNQAERVKRAEKLADRPESARGGDVLSRLLYAVRLAGELVDEFTVDGPSVRHAIAADRGALHLVEAGVVTVRAGRSRWQLRAGDAILLPMGVAHEVRSDSPGSQWLTGTFTYDTSAQIALLTGLPQAIVLSGVRERGLEWFDVSRRLLLKERDEPSPGSDVMIARILDLLFIQFLRVWASGPDAAPGWLRAAGDPVIGSVLDAVHADVARPWSVGELAGVARLSRSGFVERFRTATGVPPMTYVVDLRMDLARDLLRSTSQSVGEIARRAGYGSDAAFTRAFTQREGVSPTRWRRLQ
jgi:AraC-like DNA-binding protein/quercetin dioxygenase-like cupin family protein